MAQSEKLRIVVCGYIGLFPAGGAVWDYVQYVLGFAAMGHDVWYIEDTGNWPAYVPEGEEAGQYNVRYLAEAMRSFGLEDRWAYHDLVSESWFGMDEASAHEIMSTADVFVSVSCSARASDLWSRAPVRIVIDSDPMFTQLQLQQGTGFTRGAKDLREKLEGYTHHFTFGEKMGSPDCRVPPSGFDWLPTRQPVALDLWSSETPAPGAPFTTVMNWTAVPPIIFDGVEWGQKDAEFDKIIDLPALMPEQDFAVVVAGLEKPTFPRSKLEAAGWRLLLPGESVPDATRYQRFIQASAGEISIAKQAYVKSRSGWFSCRTACYLAAGRPAVVQDTGWSDIIPEGDGLQGFANSGEAAEKMRMIAADLPRHSRGAREIAAEYFDAAKVLGAMLDACRVPA